MKRRSEGCLLRWWQRPGERGDARQEGKRLAFCLLVPDWRIATMLRRLENKVALITGAGGGIGRAALGLTIL